MLVHAGLACPRGTAWRLVWLLCALVAVGYAQCNGGYNGTYTTPKSFTVFYRPTTVLQPTQCYWNIRTGTGRGIALTVTGTGTYVSYPAGLNAENVYVMPGFDNVNISTAVWNTHVYTYQASMMLPGDYSNVTVLVVIQPGAHDPTDGIAFTLYDSLLYPICANNSVTTIDASAGSHQVNLYGRGYSIPQVYTILPYPPNWHCSFVVYGAAAYTLNLQVNTGFQWMERDGSLSVTLVLPDQNASYSMPPTYNFPVQLTTDTILVDFVSGKRPVPSGMGFFIDVSNAATYPALCNGTVVVTDSGGVIQSTLTGETPPTYHGLPYLPNTYCEWHIVVDANCRMHLYNMVVSTTALKDLVSIYDGPDTTSPLILALSGSQSVSQPEPYSSTNELTIVFTSDDETYKELALSGFSLAYEAVNIGNDHPSLPWASPDNQCSGVTVLDTIAGEITLGHQNNFANSYILNTKCAWIIPAPPSGLIYDVQIVLTGLGYGDELRFYSSDGPDPAYLDRVISGVVCEQCVGFTGRNGLYIEFESDGTREPCEWGFDVQYNVGPYLAPCSLDTPVMPPNSYVLYPTSSFGFGGANVLPQQECVIRLDFGPDIDIMLQLYASNVNDNVRVINGTSIDGPVVPAQTANYCPGYYFNYGNPILIHYKSGNVPPIYSGGGFEYMYRILPRVEFCKNGNTIIPFTYTANIYFRSPLPSNGYSTDGYPPADRDCSWTINSPPGGKMTYSVKNLSLRDGDVLMFYDGNSTAARPLATLTSIYQTYSQYTPLYFQQPTCNSLTVRLVTRATSFASFNNPSFAGFDAVTISTTQMRPSDMPLCPIDRNLEPLGSIVCSSGSTIFYYITSNANDRTSLARCNILTQQVYIFPLFPMTFTNLTLITATGSIQMWSSNSYFDISLNFPRLLIFGSLFSLNQYVTVNNLTMPQLIYAKGFSFDFVGSSQLVHVSFPNVVGMDTFRMQYGAFGNVSMPLLRALTTLDFGYTIVGHVFLPSLTTLGTFNQGYNYLYSSLLTGRSFTLTNLTTVTSMTWADPYGSIPLLASVSLPQLAVVVQTMTLQYLPSWSMPALRIVGDLHVSSYRMTTLDFGNALVYANSISIDSTPFVGSFNFTHLRARAMTMSLSNLQYLTDVQAPLVNSGNIYIASVPQVLNVNVSGFIAGVINVITGNTLLRPFSLNKAIALDLSVGSGNTALTEIVLPAVRSSRNINVQSLDVAVFSAPGLVRADQFTLLSTRIPVLSMPEFLFAGTLLLQQNLDVATLNLPKLTWVFSDLHLIDFSLTAISLPNLVTVYYSVEISTNQYMNALYLCKLAFVGYQLRVVNSNELSCYETRQQFRLLPLVMSDDNCKPSAIGTYGCASNFTRTVNTTDCGFTVACIQKAISASFTNSSITVVVPAGTYRNCSSPLTFLGRSLVLRGEGMHATVIDCEWHGTGFVANQAEGSDTSMSDLTFMRGNATDSGGAFTISGASPLFARIRFFQNMAVNGGGAGLITNGQPAFYGCMFDGNMASTGGAVSLIMGAAPSFSACNFTANTASGSGGALAYSGAVSPAWLSDAYISDNVAARGGGIYTDIAVQAARLTLRDNVATQYGGAIAAVPDAPTGVMLVASNLVVQGNAAPKGGAFFLYSCGLTLLVSTLSGNQAISGGGAISAACSVTYRTLTGLVGPCDLTLNLTDTRLLGNTVASGNGGALSAQDVRVVMDRVNASLNHAGGGGGALYIAASDVTATTSSVAFNSAGGNGGGVYCEARGICKLAGVTVENNRASLAGGGLFFCLSSCSDTGTGRVAPDVASSTFHDNSVDAAGYGAKIATDPAALTFEVPPANQVVSGFPLAPGADQSLRVLIQDNYGQTVSSTINVLQLFLHDENGLATDVVLSGSTTVLASAGDALFVGTTAVARAVSQTNQRYTLTCQHSSIANVLVSANFTLLPCQNGQGVPPEKEASGMFCADCTIGTYANADTNLTCVACAAGSIGTAPREANCSLCPADTFQPSPGTANCIPCADGASAPPGSVTCSSKPAAIVDGKDAGGISTTVYYIIGAILLCFILVCLVATRFVYKYSRRKTMEKYYLDEDATVRRGVGESSLALAVRKFITASTTTRIGGGEFTDVYKGRHEGQWIALKVLKGEMVGHAIAQSEFRREVIALSTMNAMKHPAIIELKFYLERSPVCIGLQFCPNGSLKRSLATMQLKDHDKVRMMAQLASAIVALHNHSIAHCDLKTDNILLDDDNNVRLADYGISRLLNQGDKASGSPYGTRGPSSGGGSNLDTFGTIDTMGGEDKSLYAGNPIFASMANSVALNTVTGAMTIISEIDEGDQAAFTPQYVDPYRLQHEDDMSDGALRRADVFSFGMVMWALAKQEEPFAGVDPVLLAEQRRDRPDMRPGELKDCHPCYERIMHRAWDTQPHARPTMAEVLVMLRTCLTDHFGADLPPAYLEVGESLPSADDNAHRSVAGFSAHSLGGATSQGGEDTGSDRFGGPVVHSGGSSVTAEMRDRGGSASGSGPGGAEYGATPPSAPMMAPQVFDSMVATTNGPVYVPPAGAAAANSMVFETSRSSNYLAGPPVPDETDAAASNAQLQVLQTSRGPPVRGASGAPAPAFSMATDGGGGGANNAPNGDPNGALASVMFPTMMGGRGSGMSDASGGIGGIGAMPAMGGLGGEDPTMFPTLHGPLPVPVKSPKPARG